MFVIFLLLGLLQTVLKPILGWGWLPAVLELGPPWFDPDHAQGEGTDSAQADVATLGKGGGIAVCWLNNPCSTQSIAASKNTRKKEQQLPDSSSFQPGQGTQTLSPHRHALPV